MPLPEEYEHQAIRKECVDEQTLISHRMTWTLMMQAFLFTAFSVSLANGAVKSYWWFTFVAVPILGLLVALSAKRPIDAAIRTIEFWHGKEEEFYKRHDDYRLLDRRDRGDHHHWLSMRFPQTVPNMLIAVWVFLGGFGLIQSWFRLLPILP